MPTSSPGTVTQLLARMRSGDPEALDRLYPLVYGALKEVAHGQLRRQREPHLATTELVHETYLKLVGSESLAWKGRGHFFALAARAMRQILVDDARRRLASKRERPSPAGLTEMAGRAGPHPEVLLAVDQGLDRLNALNPRLRRVVELKFFSGLKAGEIAELLEVTPRTVERDWAKARLFLHRELHPEAGEHA